MAAQNINRAAVLAPPAARAAAVSEDRQVQVPRHVRRVADISGGFGQAGVDAIEKFLDARRHAHHDAAGRCAIRSSSASRASVDTETPTGVNAQKPLIQAEIMRTDHPVFYGYANKIFPIKFGQGSQVFRVGVADQGNVLAQYVGGDASVLSGLMVGRGQHPRPRVRGGRAEGAQRQRSRDHVREQPDLPLAEPRRVQHGVQLDHELERRSRTAGSQGGAIES